jgi:hypothetical protein
VHVCMPGGSWVTCMALSHASTKARHFLSHHPQPCPASPAVLSASRAASCSSTSSSPAETRGNWCVCVGCRPGTHAGAVTRPAARTPIVMRRHTSRDHVHTATLTAEALGRFGRRGGHLRPGNVHACNGGAPLPASVAAPPSNWSTPSGWHPDCSRMHAAQAPSDVPCEAGGVQHGCTTRAHHCLQARAEDRTRSDGACYPCR